MGSARCSLALLISYKKEYILPRHLFLENCIHTLWLYNWGLHLLPGFENREYVTPSLLKERVHLLPRKNNYLEPWKALRKHSLHEKTAASVDAPSAWPELHTTERFSPFYAGSSLGVVPGSFSALGSDPYGGVLWCITSRRHSDRDGSTPRMTYHGNPWGLPAVDPATSRVAAVITGCCRYGWAPITVPIYSSVGCTLSCITIQRGRRMLHMYLSRVVLTCDVRNDVGAELI